MRVCDCNEDPLARDHWVCTVNNEGALNKKQAAVVVPDRPYKILLAQVGGDPVPALSFSHPLFGVSVLFLFSIFLYLNTDLT